MSDLITSIYITNAKSLLDDDLFDVAYNIVTDVRKNKIDQFHFKKDKILSLASELLLLYSLKNIGCKTDKIEFSYGTNKKPYLKNMDNIFYNISHSGEYAICVISSNEIGCDIELVDDINLDIAKRFFSNKEFDFINSFDDHQEKVDIFYKLWTLKESFLKNTGLGLSLPLKNFSINIDEPITVNQNINDNEYFFKLYNVERYKCAVCSLTNDLPSAVININPDDILKYIYG